MLRDEHFLLACVNSVLFFCLISFLVLWGEFFHLFQAELTAPLICVLQQIININLANTALDEQELKSK